MMTSIIKNCNFAVSMLGNYRHAHPLLSLMPQRYPNRVHGGEDLVLEGFARSGNSFFHNAMMLWNPGLEIAHHSHLFCNVARGLALDIPCVVVIRDPAQTVASMVVWDGRLDPRLGLMGWIHYYRQLIRVQDRCLVFRFEDIVGAPDRCLQQINDRFSLSLDIHPFSDEQKKKILTRLSLSDQRSGRGDLNASVPNEIKADRKQKVLAAIQGSSLLEKAMVLYNRIATRANASALP